MRKSCKSSTLTQHAIPLFVPDFAHDVYLCKNSTGEKKGDRFLCWNFCDCNIVVDKFLCAKRQHNRKVECFGHPLPTAHQPLQIPAHSFKHWIRIRWLVVYSNSSTRLVGNRGVRLHSGLDKILHQNSSYPDLKVYWPLDFYHGTGVLDSHYFCCINKTIKQVLMDFEWTVRCINIIESDWISQQSCNEIN